MQQDDGTLRYWRPSAQPPPPRRSRIFYGWYLLAAAMIISIAVGGASESLSTFRLPIQTTFGFSMTAFGGVLLIGALTNGLTQPFLGHLFDRFNSRRVIWVSIAVAGLATVALSWTSHYWHLVFLFGIAFSSALGGTSFGVLGPLAARWFLKRRALVLSLLLAVPAMGSIFAPLISGIIIGTYGWRVAIMALGVTLLSIALPAALIFVRNWPSERGLKLDGDPETPSEARLRGGAPVLQRGRFEVERGWRAFRSPPFWSLLTAFSIAGFADFPVSILFFSFAVESVGVTHEMGGIFIAVMAALGVIGAVALGLVADRFARKKVLGALLLAQAIALLALVSVQNLAGLWLFAVLAGASGTAWMLIALLLIADIYGLRALATLWGIAFLFYAVGKVVGPVIGGLTIELTGSYYLSFMAGASMLVLASIAAFAINEGKYSARYQAAVEVEGVGN